jgi:hypothetical protein
MNASRGPKSKQDSAKMVEGIIACYKVTSMGGM